MGSPSQVPGTPLPGEPLPPFDPLSSPAPEVPFWRREPKTRYVLLFFLTFLSTSLAGIDHYASYAFEFGPDRVTGSFWELAPYGLFYSIPVLAILGAHEFGHYIACVRYRVNASLPYFIPFPFFLTGTLGAVIRIRQPIPGKRALFDIGIAGPLAGFVVTLPVLIVGTLLSKVVPTPTTVPQGIQILELGEPLLFKIIAWLFFGPVGDGFTIVMHPIAFAAWFGMLATLLNLFPVGQLDGGHISYAVFGRKSTAVSILTIAVLIGLTIVSMSWIVWTVLLTAMLVILGPNHPRVFDEQVPLDRTRLILAAVALLVFIVCFTPAPIEPLDMLPR
jgi:membrane-associated protease RseP (regulator of RpoE activity)